MVYFSRRSWPLFQLLYTIKEQYIGATTNVGDWINENNWNDLGVTRNEFVNVSQLTGLTYDLGINARKEVHYSNRGLGCFLAYRNTSGLWIFEKYIGTTINTIDWEKDTNWIALLDSSQIETKLGHNQNKLVSQELLTRTFQNTAYHKEYAELFPNTNQSVISCVTVGDDVYDIYSRANDYIYVTLNRKVVSQIQQSLAIGSLAVCYFEGKIHILASNANTYVNTNNLVNYYTHNIANNELKFVNSLNFDTDRRICYSIIPFKGKLYTAVSYIITNTTFINAKAIVELYEVGSQFVKISDIAAPNDIWGHKFTVGNSDYYTLTQTGYYRATLSTDGSNLYCTYIGTPLSTAHTSKYLVFTKKTPDTITWINDEIQSNIRSYSSFLFHYNGEKVYFSKTYKNNNFTWAETDIVFALNGRYNKGYVGILPILSKIFGKTSNEYYNIYDNGDELVIITSFAFADERANRGTYRFSLSKKEIYQRLKGANFKDRGLLSGSMADVNIGDSFILDKQGKSNIPVWTFPYAGSTGYNYATLGKNEKIRLTYNGSDLGWTPTQIQSSESRFDSHAFEHNAQFNSFQSGFFRIPALTESEDGNILYAAGDIRYTRGEDFDIIEVGFCRSLDNGLTWQDYRKIFKREENADPSNRIHDCGLVVDKNPKSPKFGRIWAWAKMWTSDKTSITSWNGVRYIKLFRCYSDDNGLTWSEQQDVTSLIPDEWILFSPGCNQGITLLDGTLLLPFYVTTIVDGVTRSQATFMYSNDFGTTWQLGDIVPTLNTNENAIIQREDGLLVMNSRDEKNTVRRVFTLNFIGDGWVYHEDKSTMKTVICNESLVYNRGVYLFSQPAPSNTTRRDITIWKSKDLIKWEKLIQVNDYASGGYSNLILTDTRCGILSQNVH